MKLTGTTRETAGDPCRTAHSRFGSARWLEPLTAPGAAQACPACLPSPSNQLTFRDEPRLGRPFIASSLVPSARLRAQRIGGFTSAFPAILPTHDRPYRAPFPAGHDHRPSIPSPAHTLPIPERRTRRARTSAHHPLTGHRGESRINLPFHPASSVCRANKQPHPQRLAMLQNGRNSDRHPGQTSTLSAFSTRSAQQRETPVLPRVFNLSHAPGHPESSDLTGHSPRPNVMEQSDFPGGNHIALFAAQKSRFSACQARSETKSIFSPNPKILNPIK